MYFKYLTTLQTRRTTKGFSRFTSDSCTLAKYTKLCMIWQPNIRNMLWAFGAAKPSTVGSAPGHSGGLPSPISLCPPTSKSWLHHWCFLCSSRAPCDLSYICKTIMTMITAMDSPSKYIFTICISVVFSSSQWRYWLDDKHCHTTINNVW